MRRHIFNGLIVCARVISDIFMNPLSTTTMEVLATQSTENGLWI